jgi:hypothetical protein
MEVRMLKKLLILSIMMLYVSSVFADRPRIYFKCLSGKEGWQDCPMNEHANSCGNTFCYGNPNGPGIFNSDGQQTGENLSQSSLTVKPRNAGTTSTLSNTLKTSTFSTSGK